MIMNVVQEHVLVRTLNKKVINVEHTAETKQVGLRI